jgi:hypothetical protein
MQFPSIPYSFVREQINLSWCDALWGYEHQLFGWSDIVDLAVDRLCSGSDDMLETELAGMTKMDTSQIGELLRKLAIASPKEDSISVMRKWLYLVLAWLFENKNLFSDPLGEVENVYTNFDYPAEIENFVRYMPVTDGYDPSAHTKDENEDRLLSHWKNYLDTAQAEFKNI